jgi:nucleoredoxin
MRTLACGLAFFLVCALGAPATATQGEMLTLPDLVGRPDRWPPTVTLAKGFTFSDGRAASAGQSVRIAEFDGSQVVVDAGGGLVFAAAPEDCDLLGAANQAWSALTPAQRAVDPEVLLTDASLWPERVTSFAAFALDDGTELAPNAEYDLLSYDREGVRVFSSLHRTTLVADVAQTDFVTRARLRALIAPDQRPSRIAAALASGLVDSDGNPVAGRAIQDAKVYVLYYSAGWCGPCRKFSPKLVELIRAKGKENPRLTTVLLSNDRSTADMLAYMKDEEMPWPALPLELLGKTPLLLGYAAGSIPHMVVLDRHGLVLATSLENGRNTGCERPLQALAKLLESGAAK